MAVDRSPGFQCLPASMVRFLRLGIRVNDVVGMVPSPDEGGYFLVGSDGGVFALRRCRLRGLASAWVSP
jgi:hypothetical protein